MDFQQVKSVRYLCLILGTFYDLVHVSNCRGSRHEELNLQPKSAKDIEARDPRPVSYFRSRSREPMEGAYSQFDLGIFGEYYPTGYVQFIGTPAHQSLRNNTHNETLVCANYEVARNGSVLGLFTCPLPFEPDDYVFCCGHTRAEMCCFDTEQYEHEVLVGVWVFCAILVAILLMGVLCWGVLGQGWCRRGGAVEDADDFA